MFEGAPSFAHDARSDETIDLSLKQLQSAEYVARIRPRRRSARQPSRCCGASGIGWKNLLRSVFLTVIGYSISRALRLLV